MKNMRVELENAVWEALEPFTEKAIRLDLNNPVQSVAFGAIVGAVVNAVEAVINKNFGLAGSLADGLKALNDEFEKDTLGEREPLIDEAVAVLRNGLKALTQGLWEEKLRQDARVLTDENLNAEPDDWQDALDPEPWSSDFGYRFPYGNSNVLYHTLSWTPRDGYEQDQEKYPARGLYTPQSLPLDPAPWVTPARTRGSRWLEKYAHILRFEPREGYEQDPEKYPEDARPRSLT